MLLTTVQQCCESTSPRALFDNQPFNSSSQQLSIVSCGPKQLFSPVFSQHTTVHVPTVHASLCFLQPCNSAARVPLRALSLTINPSTLQRSSSVSFHAVRSDSSAHSSVSTLQSMFLQSMLLYVSYNRATARRVTLARSLVVPVIRPMANASTILID